MQAEKHIQNKGPITEVCLEYYGLLGDECGEKGEEWQGDHVGPCRQLQGL